jgi:hypothetical protein
VVPNQNQNHNHNPKITPPLKLVWTSELEAVRELLCRIHGVSSQQRTKLLGGSFIGIKEANQAKQITELLKRFIVR